MILKRLFQKSPTAPRSLYETIVAAARRPELYVGWGVPDTVDGRFDMITLHAFVILDRLKGEAAAFRQELVHELFRDMDRSLREMGVGDLSVGKKVRKMAEVFYGRIAAYSRALDEGGTSLEESLIRNVYAGGPPPDGAAALAAHLRAMREHLAAQETRRITAGAVSFREP